MADPTSEPTEPPMIPLAEAATRTGRHPEALRSMIRRGQLAARRDNRRGWLVALPQPAEQPDGPAADQDMAGLGDALAELREEVAGLREALARSEAGRDTAAALARAEGEARTAKAEAEVAAQRELVTELRAVLADARRPFWRRWLTG
jgi:hypothetical protein